MLLSNIRDQLRTAMREKDQTALETLRGVVSAVQNELVATGKTPQDEADDTLVQKVIVRLVKQRKDAIEQFSAGGRSDLAETEQAQLVVLEKFLPAQMSDADIRVIAERKKAELAVTDKTKAGILTGAVMKEVAGAADGTRVKAIIESLL
ncbi:MAG TPA: GatB/YqeY domain-containing protein [Candidatus Paceibacterota bacterium]|nr:GatB/YqeY domain-containing protein [Candidatus Paceibacterota bacterium]